MDFCLVELDGSARKVAYDIQLINSLGLQPYGESLRHSDSARDHINCYGVLRTVLRARSSFFRPPKLAHRTAGWFLKMLGAGSLFFGQGVGVHDPSGSSGQRIEIPEPMCITVGFGGYDLKDLYIVIGSLGPDRERAGVVYVQWVDVTGLAVPLARVPVSS